MKEKLAVIISTKDRPREIERLLRNISGQEILPVGIIIVDGGTIPLNGIRENFPDLNIVYVRKIPPSLTAQRNEGIRALSGEATLVAFLDDDIVLEGQALKNMMNFWENASADVVGASFNNTTDAYEKPGFLERIFLVNANRPGRILASGFQSKICSLSENTEVQWLSGYAMIYRRRVLDEYIFDEWFSGYARYEDVDFSYAISKRHKLFVVADARVRHLNRLEDPAFSFALGRMETINRVYFVRKHKQLSPMLCYWALFGLFVNNIVKGVFCADRRYIKRALGGLSGFIRLALFSRNPFSLP